MRRLGTIGVALAVSAKGVATPSNPVVPLLIGQWPSWAKEASESRQPGDIGLGDTIVHLIGDERSEAFQKLFKEKVGKDCGCTARQAWLNARFPYV